MDETRSNQRVYHGSRTYRRTVTEIRKTVTGFAGKVRIRGRDFVARHWFENQWASSYQLWDAWTGR